MADEPRRSRLPGFREAAPAERLKRLAAWADLTDDEAAAFTAGLDGELVDGLVENAIGFFGVPVGVATNFVVNGRDVLVPMAVEESSVIAAASFGAKVARATGGFRAQALPPQLTVAQIQLLDVPDDAAARRAVTDARPGLLQFLNDAHPSLVKRGGGARALDVRHVTAEDGEAFLVVHLSVDVQDAMGANLVNTFAERLAPVLADLTGGRPLLRILTNLTDKRLARADAVFPADLVGGPGVVRDVVRAWALADADPYRAATHNKGILNGVGAVVLATGNDWRAVDAGAHAFAARTGRYRALSKFWVTPTGDLAGRLELPLALGTVGGATKVHPAARAALKVLGAPGARDLAAIAASVGLAQNFSALRALAAEGIQRGHMRLHARNLAATAGVPPEGLDKVVALMLAEDAVPSASRAAALWADLKREKGA